MKNDLERRITRYKREIKRNLLCGTKLSGRYLTDLGESIDNYVSDNKVTDFSDIESHFGTPEQIARDFLAQTDISVIRKKLRLKRIIAFAVIAALLIWGIGVLSVYIDSLRMSHGYIVETIEDITVPVDIPEGATIVEIEEFGK